MVSGHTGLRRAQVKTAVQHLQVIRWQSTRPRLPTRRRCRGVGRDRCRTATESNAVDSRLAGMPSDNSLKRLLVRKSIAPAREHAGGLRFAFEGKGACGVGVATRHVVEHQPLQDFAVVLKLRQTDFAYHSAREGAYGERCGPHGHGFSPRIHRLRRRLHLRPLRQ